MSLLGKAAAAIWQNVLAETLADCFGWHRREPMAERVAIPGSLRGRRHVAPHGTPAYSTLYGADTLEVPTCPGRRDLVRTMRHDVESGRESAQRFLVEAKPETPAGRPGIVGAHRCPGDIAAGAIETNQRKSRPTRALAPI